MKRLLLSFCSLALIAGGASAQSVAYGYNKQFKKAYTGDEQVYYGSQNGSRVTSYTDTIWYDAFDNPNTWAISNQNSNGWEITTAAAGSTWYFANTDIISTSGGNFALLVPDTPDGTQSATLHTMTSATPIDISSYSNQNLVLTYEKYGARFLDTLKVQVRNENTDWITLDDNTDFPLLSTSGGSVTANPASRDLFIPTNIVNGNNLFVRFTWDADNANQPAIGYGWFVDDVGVFDVPSTDLALDQHAWFDDARILYSWYYGAMPVEQAETDQITWSAAFTNRGGSTVSNAQLEMSVSGAETATFTSAAQNVAAGQEGDTARTTAVWAPTAGEGIYTITWELISDSTDAIPANNTVVQDLLVTDNEFSMAPLPVSEANIVGKAGDFDGGAYTLTQDYFFNAQDTIQSMGIAFDSEWTNVGASFQLSILDNEDQLMTASEIYLVDECMVTDDLVYFPLPQVVIEPGNYQARIEVFSDSLFLVTCQDPVPPIEPAPGGGFFSRTTLSIGGSNYIEDMAYLTIRTKTNPTCNANAAVAGLATNLDDESAEIEILDVTGLSGCVFTYDWSSSNGFSSDNQNVEVSENGTYTIVVTDADGCTATADFNVSGLSVGEIFNNSNISIFPNPTHGDFNLQFNNVNGAYNVNVTNALGQVVMNRQINVSGSTQTVEFSGLNLDKGVYSINVQDMNGNGAVATQKIVVQ